MRRTWWLLAMATACSPATVQEAEARGDASWLDTNGSADAVAALGRLADAQPRALEALQKRATFDVNAYIAAWVAAKRGQGWGATLLKGGLANPLRAEAAASAMPRRDPLLSTFVNDIEASMARLAAGTSGASLGGLLASIGPTAHAAVERRLKDGASRGAMCSGIAAPDASADARAALLAVPPESRDNFACVMAVVAMAEQDSTLAWLAASAEPGLLSSIARATTVPCARLHTLWTRALAERSPQVYAGLTVPIAASIKRCASTMDGVLSDALTRIPSAHATIVQAIDPYAGETRELKITCKLLEGIAASNAEAPMARERALDTVQHGCRGTR